MYKFFLTDSPTPKYETQQKSMFKTLLGGNVLNPLLPNMQGCEVKSHVFSWSRSGFSKLLESESVFLNCWSRVFKTVGVRSRNICCNYRLQCLLNNLN